ncbi:unnamed protein product [Camellia sinensis]
MEAYLRLLVIVHPVSLFRAFERKTIIFIKSLRCNIENDKDFGIALQMGLNQLKTKGAKMELSMTQPDDWHLHLCDGDLLEGVSSHSCSGDTTTPEENKLARESGVVYAVKLYPAGATTNSQDGVTDLFGKCLPVLEEMVKHNMPLLVHGEVTDPEVDIFDRERVFIDTVLRPLIQKFPQLKVVMEHVTTADAVRFVESCSEGFVAATITPQHLVLNRNSLFQRGLQPHNYCLPVLKERPTESESS